MKKLFFMLSMSLGLVALAQKSNVESAAIYLRNLEMEDAKKTIDLAAVHPETQNDPKMWFYRAAIYDTIYRNNDYKALANNIEEDIVIACKKCVELDVKKRYEYYCGTAIINSAFLAYNKALEFYQKKDAANAAKFFQYVIDIMPYDKNKDLVKNNINERTITLSLADLALKTEKYDDAKKHLQKLIDLKYQDPIVYILMANIYYMAGDTTKGLTYTEQGRNEFKSDKDLINQELNIYLAQGKQKVLLDKLNEALEIDGENSTLLFVRGNVYDNFSATASKTAKTYRDSSATISKKAKAQSVPATKAKMEATAKNLMKMADSLTIEKNKFVKAAESDYTKAVEVNPEYLDAHYNLGALTNNKTIEWVEKMNAVTGSTQAEYDKKWNALKVVQDSILNVALKHFNKAIELAEGLPEDSEDKIKFKNGTLVSLYYSVQQVYANLGDEKRTLEYMKKRKALE